MAPRSKLPRWLVRWTITTRESLAWRQWLRGFCFVVTSVRLYFSIGRRNLPDGQQRNTLAHSTRFKTITVPAGSGTAGEIGGGDAIEQLIGIGRCSGHKKLRLLQVLRKWLDTGQKIQKESANLRTGPPQCVPRLHTMIPDESISNGFAVFWLLSVKGGD